MKWLCLVLLLCAATSFGADFYEAEHSGDQPNHLTPPDALGSYDQRIAEHLFKTSGELGRFIRRSSFGPESCVSVHAEASKENKKKYFVTFTQAAESLWYSMAENNDEKKTRVVAVTRNDREISLDLAIAIQRVWGKMLHLTKYPAKDSRGLDGTTYQFSVWVMGLGDLYGETWSPHSGLPKEMVSLGNGLIEFTSNKETQEKPLIDRLKNFETTIPKP